MWHLDAKSIARSLKPHGKLRAYAPILSFKLVYFCTQKVSNAKTYKNIIIYYIIIIILFLTAN